MELQQPSRSIRSTLAARDAAAQRIPVAHGVATLQRRIGNRAMERLIVQRITEEDLVTRGARTVELATTAPASGANLWQAKHGGSAIFVLGSYHYGKLYDFPKATQDYLVKFLREEHFDDVYTETVADHTLRANFPSTNLSDAITNLRTEMVSLQRVADGGQILDPELNQLRDSTRKEQLLAKQKLGNIQTGDLAKFLELQLDDQFMSLATGGKQAKKLFFEDDPSRLQAKKNNARDMNIGMDDPRLVSDDSASGNEDFYRGNERKAFGERAGEMLKKREPANVEERNRQWMDVFQSRQVEGGAMRQLWIVGASHVSGLVLRLKDLGWDVGHMSVG